MWYFKEIFLNIFLLLLKRFWHHIATMIFIYLILRKRKMLRTLWCIVIKDTETVIQVRAFVMGFFFFSNLFFFKLKALISTARTAAILSVDLIVEEYFIGIRIQNKLFNVLLVTQAVLLMLSRHIPHFP